MIPDADLLLPKPWSNISLLRFQIINRKNLLRITISKKENAIKNVIDVQLKIRKQSKKMQLKTSLSIIN